MTEYSDFVRQYLTVAIFAGVGIGLGAGLLGIGKIFRPTRPQEQKYLVYESGVDPVGSGWSQSQIRYYVFALLFVIFDVEALFLYAYAVSAKEVGWMGWIEAAIFIFILTASLVYLARIGALDWTPHQKKRRAARIAAQQAGTSE